MNPLLRLVRALRRALAGPQNRAARRRAASPLGLCLLEDRDVPAASLVRSIDGSGNNLANPTWGQAGTDFVRLAPVGYGDGISTPGGADRPSARTVSNTVDDQQGQDTVNSRLMSAMVYAWGQFVDHDLDSTRTGTVPFNIAVPKGDPYVRSELGTGTQVIYADALGKYDAGHWHFRRPTRRQQVNDHHRLARPVAGSTGPSAATTDKLRSHVGGTDEGERGRLPAVEQFDQLPDRHADDGQRRPPAPRRPALLPPATARANENPELTSLQTLFVREHNRIAGRAGEGAIPGLDRRADLPAGPGPG